MKEIIVAVLLLIGGWWLADKAYKELYLYAEKKPFWNGTEEVQVCKRPYYSSDDCYRLKVTLYDGSARIYFSNGGYKDVFDIECWFGADYDRQPRYVFCESWDDTNQQWDFLPTWVYY